VVKILDGRAFNGAFWVFYGALSDVEYTLDVRDLETGEMRSFYNPPGEICGGADTDAFPEPLPALAPSPPSLVRRTASPSCTPDSETLCAVGGRVSVSVQFRDPRDGSVGRGEVLAATEKSGLFSFFNPGNLELVVKVLDGTAINGELWVFYGALSDVEYRIDVTDHLRGTTRSFENPAGEICGGADIDG